MTGTTTQSIFQTTQHKPTWQSYAFSMVLHSVLAFLALTIVVVPAVREARRQIAKVSLVAPLPAYKEKVQPHITAPKIVLKREPVVVPPVQKVFIPPPVIKTHLEEPKIVAAAPEVKEVPPQQLPELKVPTPPAPKPVVKVGTFQPTSELAKAAPAQQKASVGGFGDPHGVPPSDSSRNGPVTMARVGAFDLPTGSGRGGAGGQAQDGGSFRHTGFGSGGPSGRPQPSGLSGVQNTGFGDATKVAEHSNTPKADSAGALTPVQILYKPKPVYSSEARQMRLEGQVTLQVVFQANGTVRVVKVLRSLGHGLDEAAQEAAGRVKFKPATRGGLAVDTDATINITFELT